MPRALVTGKRRTALTREVRRLPRDVRFSASGVAIHFGGVRAVDGVDLTIASGEILGLIGPNGAGKTTMLNGLSGFQRLHAGTVRLGTRPITGLPPHRLARMGIVRTFQNVRLFPNFSVFRNVLVSGLGVGLSRRAAEARAREALERVGLAQQANARAAALPLGEERLVGLARAIALRPRFLLLDEPAAGLNEGETGALMLTIRQIALETGCGILVIEHDMRMIMGVCERVQVLVSGKTLAVGTPAEIRSDDRVVSAYLGTSRADASSH